MCVIVHKPAGVNLTSDTLYQMWIENPDGAGIAYYNDENKLTVEKGFMKLKRLKRALRELGDRDIIIHFRWATHGKVTPDMCHPFVIDTDLTRARGTDATERQVLFHNGIIDGYGNKVISDTIDFVTRTLSRIPLTETRVNVLTLMKGRYCLLTEEMIWRIGDWEEYQGLYVSNLNWVFTRKSPVIGGTAHILDHDWNTEWSWEEDMYMENPYKVTNYQKGVYLDPVYDELYEQAEYEAYSAASNTYTSTEHYGCVKGPDGKWYSVPVESEI